MNVFESIYGWFASVPDFVPLLVVPAALLLSALLFFFLGGRKYFGLAAAAEGLAGGALLAARDLSLALFYGALFALAAVLLRLLLLIPFKRKKREEEREEAMYEKFRLPLGEAPMPAAPSKVCCFETDMPVASAEESGARLTHAGELLERLKRAKLSPSDRLEAESLTRMLAGFGGRMLTEEELRSLNDCLARTLKLTAKYKL